MSVSKAQEIPVNVVGSSVFGRFPKISLEKTYNMFMSNDWLINYAGFKKQIDFLPSGEGRALFHSIRGNFLIAVVSSEIYRIDSGFIPLLIGKLDTSTDHVSIDQNLSDQICIVDSESAYIYNYVDGTFTKQNLVFIGNPIIPGYVCYHNSFFLITSSPNSINPQNWYAFERDTNSTLKFNSQFAIQTKPDFSLAIKRLPGRGNNILVLGSAVCEVWGQVGGAQNYQRVQSFNIDNGVVSIETIAANDDFVCFLGKNESNAPSLMVTDGSSSQRISSDGIDFLLSTIQNPDQSTAFFYRQDGHLFYQITFYSPEDNLSLIYDFSTKLFFHISDENLNYYPARNVVYFNQDNYFISLNDASIYKINNSYDTYDYSRDIDSIGLEIPRIRICKSIRKENSDRMRIGSFCFWIEQGESDVYYLKDYENSGVHGLMADGGFVLTPDGGFVRTPDGGFVLTANYSNDPVKTMVPRVDMSFSKNGNQSFSNTVERVMNTAGKYKNIMKWDRLGQCNEFTVQLRFWGFNRFVVGNGVAEVY